MLPPMVLCGFRIGEFAGKDDDRHTTIDSPIFNSDIQLCESTKVMSVGSSIEERLAVGLYRLVVIVCGALKVVSPWFGWAPGRLQYLYVVAPLGCC